MTDQELDFLVGDLEQENRLLRARNDRLTGRKPLRASLIKDLYAKYPDPVEFCRAIEKEHEIV